MAAVQLLDTTAAVALEGIDLETLASPAGAAHPTIANLRLRSHHLNGLEAERTSLAVLDTTTRELHLFAMDFHPAVAVSRTEESSAATDTPKLGDQAHRQLVVEELGNKKRLKKLQRAKASARGALRTDAELSRVLDSVANAQAPATEGTRLARLRALLPSFNAHAADAKGIYKLSSLMSAKELEGVNVEGMLATIERAQAPPLLLRLTAHAQGSLAAKPQSWLRYLALLHHALVLFRFKKIRPGLPELARQTGLDARVLRALIERYWQSAEGGLVLGQFQRFRLTAFVVVLALLLFGLECRVDDLREGLQLRQQELVVLLRSVGCATETREGQLFCRLQRIKL